MRKKPYYQHHWCYVILYIIIGVIFSPELSQAARFHGTGMDIGANPRGHGGCEHSARSGDDRFECWVDRPRENENSYFDPKIAVNYAASLFGELESVSRRVLGHAECRWMWWYYPAPFRVCARFAAPGEYGNNSDKLKICAYEDPCDAMDCVTHGASMSPFHHNTPRETQIDPGAAAAGGAAAGALIGLMVGGPIGLLAGAAIGAAVGALTAVITNHYNHIVFRDIGCIQFPLPEGPPRFENDAFFGPQPHPTVSLDDSATFELPTVKLRVCQDPTSTPPNKQVLCKADERVNNVTVATQTVTPRKSGTYDTCVNDADSYEEEKDCNYEACITPSTLDKQYCAIIKTSSPHRVCVYHRDGSRDFLVKCMDRPGHLPLPSVMTPSSASNTSPEVRVTMGTGSEIQTITLQEDSGLYTSPPSPTAGWTDHCGILHQVEFCATRECLARSSDPTTSPDYNASTGQYSLPTACIQYQSKVCVAGYDIAPVVAIDTASGNILGPSKNTVYSAGSTVPNDPYPSFKLPHDVSIYRNDLTTTADDLNPATQSVRQLVPSELALCVPIPPSTRVYEYGVGTHTFTPPENCEQIRVHLIGGGGSGHAEHGDGGGCSDHYSGGAGAQGIWRINVTPGDPLTVVVGNRSTASRGNGGGSYLMRGGSVLVRSNGGLGRHNSSCDSLNCNSRNGALFQTLSPNATVLPGAHNGEDGHCNWEWGYNGPGGGTSAGSCGMGNIPSTYGAGGCTHDYADDEPWGYGGYGRAYVNCVWPYE